MCRQQPQLPIDTLWLQDYQQDYGVQGTDVYALEKQVDVYALEKQVDLLLPIHTHQFLETHSPAGDLAAIMGL